MSEQDGGREKQAREPTRESMHAHPHMTFEKSLEELEPHSTGWVSLNPSPNPLLSPPSRHPRQYYSLHWTIPVSHILPICSMEEEVHDLDSGAFLWTHWWVCWNIVGHLHRMNDGGDVELMSAKFPNECITGPPFKNDSCQQPCPESLEQLQSVNMTASQTQCGPKWDKQP